MGKIGHFLGKIKSLHAQQGKIKGKSHNLNKKARKHPHFPASLFPHFSQKTNDFGKKEGYLGKNPMFLGKLVLLGKI
ncbi:hypothetical protein [Segatella copri]|uniref:hypothetical protein n=1 Tax=Segatella copri TaxID=165179 RepID=UPI0022E0DE2B|nr:hypothetical protein [Segatella copri]